jgi:uncharacterized protein
VVALTEAGKILDLLGETTLSASAQALAQVVNAAILKEGVYVHPRSNGSTVLAYEVDGYGNMYFMDDANLPSLLALPVYGWMNVTDPLYQRTRALVLSAANPYYFSGQAGQGTGGPHDGIDRIWPMSMISRGMTTTDPTELALVLQQLKLSTACTGLMHESIDKDNAGSFTRPWFAWANSYFAALILRVAQVNPGLIFS